MTLLYRLTTAAYFTVIRLGALLGLTSAVKWIEGRHGEGSIPTSELVNRGRDASPLLWIHAASLGEWEQGRPVVEALRRQRPDYKVLLTFFSPSGYDRCRDDELADYVRYLPADTPANARTWVKDLRPDVAVFIKYEFWFYFLRELHRAGVPTYLIAASFRPGQPFFRRGSVFNWWRRLLGLYTGIIVQTAADERLLAERAGVAPERIHRGGDPRMDRTLQLAATPFTDEKLAAFTAGDDRPTLIAGSVWPEDVRVIGTAWVGLRSDYRLVLAPHQLNERELGEWTEQFGAVRYTRASAADVAGADVLVLDTIGILSRAYRYGAVAYVGGAFRTGLHNTLEPLAYGLPVLFGPKYHKFPEAGAAIAAGGAVSIASADELQKQLLQWRTAGARVQSGEAQQRLAEANRGAGERTLNFISLP